MTLYDYNKLNDQLQYQTVWEIGKHLETVTENEEMCLLYSIGDFYVEVRYNQRTNQISGKTSFKMKAALLEKYLKEIPNEIL